jgi:hypothetical protein
MADSIRLTDQAVITAARALIIENKRCAAKLKDDSLSDQQSEYFGDYIQLLDAAMGEIEAVYAERRANNPHMGSFEALYESISLEQD